MYPTGAATPARGRSPLRLAAARRASGHWRYFVAAVQRPAATCHSAERPLRVGIYRLRRRLRHTAGVGTIRHGRLRGRRVPRAMCSPAEAALPATDRPVRPPTAPGRSRRSPIRPAAAPAIPAAIARRVSADSCRRQPTRPDDQPTVPTQPADRPRGSALTSYRPAWGPALSPARRPWVSRPASPSVSSVWLPCHRSWASRARGFSSFGFSVPGFSSGDFGSGLGPSFGLATP